MKILYSFNSLVIISYTIIINSYSVMRAVLMYTRFYEIQDRNAVVLRFAALATNEAQFSLEGWIE